MAAGRIFGHHLGLPGALSGLPLTPLVPGYAALTAAQAAAGARHAAEILLPSGGGLRVLDGLDVPSGPRGHRRVDGALLDEAARGDGPAARLARLLAAVHRRDPGAVRRIVLYQVIGLVQESPPEQWQRTVSALGVHPDEGAGVLAAAGQRPVLDRDARAAAELLGDAWEERRLHRVKTLLGRLPQGDDRALRALRTELADRLTALEGALDAARRAERHGDREAATEQYLRALREAADDRRALHGLVHVHRPEPGGSAGLRADVVVDGVVLEWEAGVGADADADAGAGAGGRGGEGAGGSGAAEGAVGWRLLCLLRDARGATGHREVTAGRGTARDRRAVPGTTVRYAALPLRAGLVAGPPLVSHRLTVLPEVGGLSVVDGPGSVTCTWTRPPDAVEVTVEHVSGAGGVTDAGEPGESESSGESSTTETGGPEESGAPEGPGEPGEPEEPGTAKEPAEAGGVTMVKEPAEADGTDAAVGSVASDGVDVVPGVVVAVDGGAGGFVATGLPVGAHSFLVRCHYRAPDGTPAVSPGLRFTHTVHPWPEPVGALTARPEGDALLFTWTGAENADVRLVEWPGAAPAPGTALRVDELPPRLDVPGPDGTTATVRPRRGGHTLVAAVAVRGERALTGPAVDVEAPSPVSGLTARRLPGGEAAVTLDWPDGTGQVTLAWEPLPEPEAGGRRTVTAHAYRRGELRLPVGPHEVRLRATATSRLPGTVVLPAPTTEVLLGPDLVVGYRLVPPTGGFLTRNRRPALLRVTLTAPGPGPVPSGAELPEFVCVARGGTLRPRHAADGTTVLRIDGADLARRGTVEHELPAGAHPAPYTLRGFLLGAHATAVRLEEPSPATLVVR